MHECISIIIDSFSVFLYFSVCLYAYLMSFNKGVIERVHLLWKDEVGRVLKSQTKNKHCSGVNVQSVKKLPDFLNSK